jgi:leucyl aminopeptidase (aminopeptidase T)
VYVRQHQELDKYNGERFGAKLVSYPVHADTILSRGIPAQRRKRVVVSHDVNAADMMMGVAKLFEYIMARVAVAVRVALDMTMTD